MTYHAGIGPGLEAFGLSPDEPNATCDGCGARAHGLTREGAAAAWLRNGKAPPGWRLERTEDDNGVTRRDYCPRCKATPPNGNGTDNEEKGATQK